MNEALERVWARWCARRVLHLWDAPEAVREWLDEGDAALREEAELRAWRADPPGMRARVRARMRASSNHAALAAWFAASGGDPAYYARSAVGAAALEAYLGTQGRSTHGHSDQELAKREELRAQQHARANIETLSALLPEHGLSALRLDEALEDRWLTREVWRALGLPDLQVVCDWTEVTR